MKKIFWIFYIILILILLKLIFFFVINETFISDYKNEEYSDKKLKILSMLNFPESYIVHYNKGNVFYQEEDYDSAIDECKDALTKHPTKKKECSIRINLALAMIAQIDFDDNSEENIQNAINTLYDARDVLCENGCANENDDNGHSEKAEQLKKDIDDTIKELEEKQNSSDSDEDEEESEKNDDTEKKDEEKESSNSESKEKRQKEELEKARQESSETRNNDLTESESRVGEEYEYYDGKIW